MQRIFSFMGSVDHGQDIKKKEWEPIESWSMRDKELSYGHSPNTIATISGREVPPKLSECFPIVIYPTPDKSCNFSIFPTLAHLKPQLMHMHHYKEIFKFKEEFNFSDTEDIAVGKESSQWSEDMILLSIWAIKFVDWVHKFPTWAKYFVFLLCNQTPFWNVHVLYMHANIVV